MRDCPRVRYQPINTQGDFLKIQNSKISICGFLGIQITTNRYEKNLKKSLSFCYDNIPGDNGYDQRRRDRY